MSLPYFNLYPRDFEADTSHLTLEEDGAYNRLLRLCWMTPGCSLPDDMGWIMRRMKVDEETFNRVVIGVISEFFTRKAGRVSSPRLTREFKKADETSRRRSDAGKKGGRPKVSENNEKTEKAGFDFVKAGPKHPEPDTDIEKREANASPKKATRLPSEWRLPMDWGEWSMAHGMTEPQVRNEADRFRDYWVSKSGRDGTKLDWQATWRNWCRTFIDRNQLKLTAIRGGTHGKPDQTTRMDAFIAGSRGSPGMDRRPHPDPSQPLLARG